MFNELIKQVRTKKDLMEVGVAWMEANFDAVKGIERKDRRLLFRRWASQQSWYADITFPNESIDLMWKRFRIKDGSYGKKTIKDGEDKKPPHFADYASVLAADAVFKMVKTSIENRKGTE